MTETENDTGAPLISLCIKANPVGRGRLLGDSPCSPFRYIEDGFYTEKTMRLPGVVECGADGKVNVKFDIPRIGDFAHTFVIKSDSYLPYDLFESFELSGSGNESYCESMTLKTNRTLAHAAGWPIDHHTIPLMIRETTDFHRCFLPLLPVFHNDGDYNQSQQLILHNFNYEPPEENATLGCVLEVNYCYLDRTARIHLAQKAGLMPMLICDYITKKGTLDFGEDCHVQDFRLEGPIKDPIRDTNTVTGLLIHGAKDLKKVEFRINGRVLETGDKSPIAWKKVGLEYHPKAYDTILVPFSRDMWTNVEEAAFVDFSRVDSLVLRCYSEQNFTGKMDLEVTALAYTTRYLCDCDLGTGKVLKGSI